MIKTLFTKQYLIEHFVFLVVLLVIITNRVYVSFALLSSLYSELGRIVSYQLIMIMHFTIACFAHYETNYRRKFERE